MRSTPAKITSKGQITIPQDVRRRLRLRPGDRVVFRVAEKGETAVVEPARGGEGVTLVKVPDLVSLAGTMRPRRRTPHSWAEIRRAAWDEEIRTRE